MGSLKLTSGHLTRTAGGHLAMCPPFTPAPCKCLDGATWKNSGDLTVTVTGTNLPTPTNFGSGDCTPGYTGATGPSIAGTYVVPCGGYMCKIVAVDVGCVTAYDVPYYVARLTIDYIASDSILVILTHGTIQNPLFTNPYPTVRDCTANFSVFSYRELAFQLSTRDPRACISGDVTPVGTLSGSGTVNPFTGVTLAMNIAAPS